MQTLIIDAAVTLGKYTNGEDVFTVHQVKDGYVHFTHADGDAYKGLTNSFLKDFRPVEEDSAMRSTTLVFEVLPDGRTWQVTTITKLVYGAPDSSIGKNERVIIKVAEVNEQDLTAEVLALHKSLHAVKVTLEFPK